MVAMEPVADRPGADRAAMQLRAMLTLGDELAGSSDRPRPKRPEVLLASGLTSQGVPELLAALDRVHDARAEHDGPQAARLARARAQVEGILADRTRDALWSSRRRAETDALMERHGIYIQPINYPTVPKGTERLRITPSPLHSDDDIDHLVRALTELWSQCALSRAVA